MKKIILFTLIFILTCNIVSFAAVSGSKARRTTPPSNPPTTQTAPSTSNSDYKPSSPAKNLNEKAPDTKQSAASTTATQPSNSGGFLRNMGMFGSGMLLGGMLSSLFGFGSTGMFAQLADMLITMLMFVGIFLIGRTLWSKIKNKHNLK